MSSRPSRLHVVVRIVLQIFSALCLLVAMNYIAFHYYRKVDYSRSHRFSLSDQGSVLFAGIRQPAHIIIYFSPTSLTEGTELYGDVEALMNEYKIKAREHLVVEYLDPIRELGRAREVQGKYKFNPNENVIVIDYLDHSTVIPMRELGEYDVTGTVSRGSPHLIAFRGEQVINAALISLSGVPLKKIYFLQGHGEFIPGESPLEIIGRYLKYQNIIPATLNLANRMEVPDDAALLVIDGAHVDFSETEIETLKNYWKQSGRFFILLDPTADTPRFCQMLTEIGITPRADRIIRTLPGKDPATIVRDVVGDFVPGSELTKQFLRLNILFLGTTQSLVLKNSDNEMQLRPLVQASYGFYRSDIEGAKEKDIPLAKLSLQIASADPVQGDLEMRQSCREQVSSTKSEGDLSYPIIAAMADHGALHDDRVAVNASRMVVVGNCDFINDKNIGEVGLDFFSSVLNGLIDRVQLTGNTAKMKTYLTLNMSEKEMKQVAIWSIVIIPVLAALFGIICIWRRRV